MSLQDPTQKMSKSHKSERSRILITDTPEEIHKKVMSAVTDSTNSVSYDAAARPGVANLLHLLSSLEDTDEGTSPEEWAQSLAIQGANLGQLKRLVSEKIIASLAGIRERYLALLSEHDGRYIDSVAEDGARRAREIAEETMAIVRSAIGL
jgi:tryptophanyl-tRNA synthetase